MWWHSEGLAPGSAKRPQCKHSGDGSSQNLTAAFSCFQLLFFFLIFILQEELKCLEQFADLITPQT